MRRLDLKGCQEWGVLEKVFLGGTVGLEEFDEVGLILSAHTLEVKDLFEVGVGFIADMDQVCLDETFWGG